MSYLQVGFGREDITPDMPVHMGGYGYRYHPSQGVHDKLYANAVALSDGAHTILLLACDVVSFDLEGDRELKGAVSAATALPSDAIITNTSHTHAGPMVVRSAYQPFEPEYYGALMFKAASAARQALATRSEATLWIGAAPVDIGANRRRMTPKGQVTLEKNPGGQALPEVTVWQFKRVSGGDVVLWSIPIHGVVLHDSNLLISAEWMGAAGRDLEANQPGLNAVFLQGCCGDQNPYRDLNSFDQVQAVGIRAAESVRAALRAAREINALPLVTRIHQVALPLDQTRLPPEPAQIPEGPRPPRPSRETQSLPLRGLRLGDALMVGMAGEPFVEYAYHGRAVSPAASTLILGYTDSTLNYLPTERAYQEGGYEPGAWIWYPDGKPWSPAIEGILKQAITAMINELWDAPQ